MKKTILITGVVIVLASAALMAFVRITSGNGDREINLAVAKQGDFEISVTSIGEIIAENFVDIKGPDIVRNRFFRPTGLKITDIVPEGTMVEKGDYIATLDRSSFENTLKDESSRLRELEAEFEMKLLDTAVILSTLRDDIINQNFATEEAAIVVAQSKYEPPSVQRQSELALEREQRVLEQKKRIYNLRLAQTSADARKLRIDLESQRMKVNDIDAVLADFTVRSPADGMVVYKRDRLGNKIKEGSMVHPFDPVIATLPDLSSLISRVFISEIDVNKIKKGQTVKMTVDAFKEKTYTGAVAGIANIGEQLANSDSKVFEVLVKIVDSDPLLRPSMTTSNKIITKTFDNVVYVPTESVLTGTDNIPYVYTSKRIKQVVVPGVSNDKNTIIEKGLTAGTSVFLMLPANHEKFTRAGTELLTVLREREREDRIEIAGI
jgi:multidrug efflux pump subunit AcrA (membrane-fusion protein)